MDISNEIIAVLDDLTRRLGVAIDWTQDNIVPFAQELFGRIVMYRIILSGAALFAAIAWTAALSAYLLRSNKRSRLFEWEHLSYYEGHFVNGNARAVIAIVLIAVSICLMVHALKVSLPAFIKCLTLPELVVLEFVRKLK